MADIANVDGCVVLDRHLQVLGFGGKIEFPSNQSSKLRGKGMRHISAASWCQRFPDGMALLFRRTATFHLHMGQRDMDLWRQVQTSPK
jgi:hypothetical protein